MRVGCICVLFARRRKVPCRTVVSAGTGVTSQKIDAIDRANRTFHPPVPQPRRPPRGIFPFQRGRAACRNTRRRGACYAEAHVCTNMAPKLMPRLKPSAAARPNIARHIALLSGAHTPVMERDGVVMGSLTLAAARVTLQLTSASLQRPSGGRRVDDSCHRRMVRGAK